MKNDNKNQKLIKKERICGLVVKGLEVDIKVKVLRGDEWQIDRELVLKKKNIYMLKDKKLRVEII